jgi:phosphoserine phosphatase
MPGRFWRLLLHHQADEGVEWTLDVRFLPDKTIAALFYPTEGRRATDALSRLESADLRTLTERSRLDEGGHIGVGGTGMAASLETLTLQNLENGRTVVLVTAGNRNFVDDPARRSLLQRLRALQVRLLSGSVR